MPVRYDPRILISLALVIPGALVHAQGPKLCGIPFSTGAETRPVLSGPVSYVASTNFLVHYTESGQDSSSQAVAGIVSSAAEDARRVYDSLGWLPPPPDSGTGGLDPDSRYDIYIVNLNAGSQSTASGICRAEAPYPDPCPRGYTSWIEIDRAFDYPVPAGIIPPDTLFRAVVAHEVNHACQNRYRKSPGRDSTYPQLYDSLWFYEQTAVCMENAVYPGINTLSRIILPLSISNPLVNMRYGVDFPEHIYTGAIWPTFLNEYYGNDAVRRVWEMIGSLPRDDDLSMIDSALHRYYSSGLNEALREYAVWRYFTGNPDSGGRADAWHFSEGASWPASEVLRIHSDYDASGNQSVYYPLGPGGANIIVFSNPPPSPRIAFNGNDAYHWDVSVVGHRTGAESYEASLGLNSAQIGVGRVLSSGTDGLVLVVVNPDTFLTVNPTYSYTATTVSDVNVPAAMSGGWNLVSVPDYLPDFSIGAVYPTALSVAWTGVPFAGRDTLSNGTGYWVKFPPYTVKTYTGAPIDILWVEVDNGWNMVGSIGSPLDTGKIFPSRGVTLQTPFWGSVGRYETVGELQPGRGYWVKVGGSGYLTYNASLYLIAPPPASTGVIPPGSPPGKVNRRRPQG